MAENSGTAEALKGNLTKYLKTGDNGSPLETILRTMRGENTIADGKGGRAPTLQEAHRQSQTDRASQNR